MEGQLLGRRVQSLTRRRRGGGAPERKNAIVFHPSVVNPCHPSYIISCSSSLTFNTCSLLLSLQYCIVLISRSPRRSAQGGYRGELTAIPLGMALHSTSAVSLPPYRLLLLLSSPSNIIRPCGKRREAFAAILPLEAVRRMCPTSGTDELTAIHVPGMDLVDHHAQ